ncbi:DUF2637 domain-containing protein [Streptomyces armeniacus]|uniref:DUF2637 domain-containing protein n=1 Tax=Streptomyces armeniacus TaxID=83291 RepID=A0A345Y036_9ACTN|nr:DUF2637 domain-containing protein [Streptomyces armeniacus]
MTRTHRILIGVVVTGAVVIAAIGFAGSYAAVRDLAEQKDFGAFAPYFPIGIDAGIVVLLALDLLLTWIRIPFPLLRQTAWLLTAATIAFNGAAAWPDPLGVGMHAVIPVLFVVAVEAARHAIGRIADITADKHMEGVRVSRWLLAFPSTFRLWRRMKLWELRSYDQVIRMEQDRLVYEARLRARYGRGWRRKAPVESLMPLRLARYGVPLAETGPAGLAAAGIKPPVLVAGAGAGWGLTAGAAPGATAAVAPAGSPAGSPAVREAGVREPGPHEAGAQGAGAQEAADVREPGVREPAAEAAPPAGAPARRHGPQHARQAERPDPAPDPAYAAEAYTAEAYAPTSSAPRVTVPVGPGRVRALGNANAPVNGHAGAAAYAPARQAEPEQQEQDRLFLEPQLTDGQAEQEHAPEPQLQSQPRPEPEQEPDPETVQPTGIPDGVAVEEVYFQAYRDYAAAKYDFPSARQLSRTLHDRFGVTDADGSLLSEVYLRGYLHELRDRYKTEMGMGG